MTEDTLLRLVVVAAVGVAAVGIALFARRGTVLLRHTVHLPGHGPGLVFFSSSTCDTCALMRERLGAWSVDEVTYETEGADFPRPVTRVPAVALLDADGKGWIAYGLVSESRLRRWLGGP